MKKVINISYEATSEEIEIIRSFYNFLDTLDEEIYKDFDKKAAELGTYEAISWLLDAAAWGD